MKIAIYDKWLSTLGGGEKVATVMAEALSKNGHEVYLVSGFEVDKRELEAKMGVDLSRVKVTAWYERSYGKLLPKTREYDLFINVSFLDHLPSGAKRSVYYIHFPTPIRKTLFGFIKYETILPFLRKFLIIPEIESGLRPIEDVYTRGGRWLEKENTVIFSNTSESFNLTLRVFAEQLSVNTLNLISFGSANAKVRLSDRYIDHAFNVMVYKLKIETKTGSAAVKIFVKEDLRRTALGLVSMTIRNPRFLAWNFIKRYLPRYEMALYGSSSYKPAEGLDSYDLFLSNSEFTRAWTKRYWDKDSKILYPPVDVDEFKPGKKKNLILNVGRFFVGGHSKKQDILLSAFKKLIDKKILKGPWELHFVGSVAGGKDHADYLNKIREESKGYPVFFHLFASFEDLKKLYSEAKIYWHATGFGEDRINNPIGFEHFGITVVEAMAAGAVPLVFNGGGLTETVDGKSGLVWDTQDQLVKLTAKVAKDKSLLAKLSKGAQERSKLFSRGKFERKLLEFVNKLQTHAKK